MSDKEVVYELAYVLRVGESESSLDEVLKSHSATVKTKSPVTSIQLAYPIKKQEVGQFGYYHLTFPTGAAVKELSDALQLKEGVIRFIVTKVPKTKPRPERRDPAAPAAAVTAVSTAATPKPSIGRVDSLSNENLSHALEDLLK